VYPIVRVPKLTEIDIQRVLDLGVAGVQIPQIQCKADAEKVKEYCRFYPKGMRGLCRYVRPADYSLKDKGTYLKEQNEVTTIIHIEGVKGLNNLDEILEVDELDVIFIGPYDLSQSLGIPAQVSHPRLLTEIEKIVKKCSERGKMVGIFTDDLPTALKYKAMGIKYISYSVDVGIFSVACKEAVQKFLVG
jgi:4-hydroxy-2-oxoheptanedioate aldolase